MLRDAAHAALAAGAPLDGAALASRALALEPLRRERARAAGPLPRAAGDGPPPRAHARRVRGAASAASSAARPTRGCAAPPTRTAPTGRRRSATARPRSGSSRPGAPRSTPARSSRASRACATPCAEARAVGDPALLARALAALGVALVHSVRGRDEEGAAVLHEALALAEEHGELDVAAKVCRELGYVEVQAGRGVSAGRWLLRAAGLVRVDEERAAVLGVRGMALSDRAHYAPAIRLLESSIAIARGCGDERRRRLVARRSSAALFVLRGELEEAEEVLEGSLALARATGWIAFLPFPEAIRAEVALRRGDPAHAAELLDHAWPLGCRLGDPCWEAMAARALGAASTRRRASARRRSPGCATPRCAPCASPTRTCGSTPTASTRSPASRSTPGAPEAPRRVARLEQLAARADMREFVVRARAAPRAARRRGRRGLRAAARRDDRQPGAARASSPPRPDHTRAHTAGWEHPRGAGDQPGATTDQGVHQ